MNKPGVPPPLTSRVTWSGAEIERILNIEIERRGLKKIGRATIKCQAGQTTVEDQRIVSVCVDYVAFDIEVEPVKMKTAKPKKK